jgi:hypothetical protein
MVDYELDGYERLPVEARVRRYRTDEADQFFHDSAQLIIYIRVARAAFQAAGAAPREWEALAHALRLARAEGSSISSMIALTQSFTQGWWRRARFPRGPQ